MLSPPPNNNNNKCNTNFYFILCRLFYLNMTYCKHCYLINNNSNNHNNN